MTTSAQAYGSGAKPRGRFFRLGLPGGLDFAFVRSIRPHCSDKTTVDDGRKHQRKPLTKLGRYVRAEPTRMVYAGTGRKTPTFAMVRGMAPRSRSFGRWVRGSAGSREAAREAWSFGRGVRGSAGSREAAREAWSFGRWVRGSAGSRLRCPGGGTPVVRAEPARRPA